MEIIREKGYELGNMDATICLQQPKINPFIPGMQQVLSRVMEVDISQVSIKATTTEKLGFVGGGKGISAYATVLVEGPQKSPQG